MLKKTNKHPNEGRSRGRHHRNPPPRPTTGQPAPRPTKQATKSRDPSRPKHPRRPDTRPRPAPKERSRGPRGCRPRSEQTMSAAGKRRKQPPRQKPKKTEEQPRKELIFSYKITKKNNTTQEKTKKKKPDQPDGQRTPRRRQKFQRYPFVRPKKGANPKGLKAARPLPFRMIQSVGKATDGTRAQ